MQLADEREELINVTGGDGSFSLIRFIFFV
jgi:hypothetical protein